MLLLSLICLGALLQEPPPAEGDVPSVAGTTWAGKDSNNRAYIFRFRADGTVNYTSPEGTFNNATWKQDGNAIYWELNNKFAEYRGTIAGKVMTGTAVTRQGAKKTWTFRLQDAAAPDALPRPGSLEGTTWTGVTIDDRPLVLRFRQGGKLEYDFDGQNYADGAWKQAGANLTFEINDKFAVYEGIVTGVSMAGSAKNQRGQSWSWKATKDQATVPSPTRPAAPAPTVVAPTIPAPRPQQTPPSAPTPVPTTPTTPTAPRPTAAIPLERPAATMPAARPDIRPFETRPAPTLPAPPASAKPASSMPARPDVRPPAGDAYARLAGTHWVGKDSDGETFFVHFDDGGKGKSSRAGKTTRDLTWRIDGDHLDFEINQGYSLYTGTIISRDRIEGAASNKKGDKWSWSLTRTTAPHDLAGTTWTGVDSDKEAFTFRFLDDGKLEFIRAKGAAPKATWRAIGNKVFIEVNNRYSTYEGTISGNAIEGTAENMKGQKWTWKVTKEK